MKLKGREIKGPNVETIVLPRGEGEPIVLTASAVLDYDEFDKMCPIPKAPEKVLKGGKKVPNYEDPFFIKEMEAYNNRRTLFLFLWSLKGTPGLEWDTVKYTDPDTWENFYSEMKTAGFSEVEKTRIINMIMKANCLDEAKLEEARASFLAGQLVQLEKSTSPIIAQ